MCVPTCDIHKCTCIGLSVSSFVPRHLATGGERAWYTLHVHALVHPEKDRGLVYYRIRVR